MGVQRWRGMVASNQKMKRTFALTKLISPSSQACLRVGLAVLLAGALLVEGEQNVFSKCESPLATEGAAVPFRVGEQLDYSVGWQNFLVAATAQVSVLERRSLYGHTAWHFQAVTHTVEPVRYLYPVDDQFDSYTDAGSLASLQFETYLRESGKHEDAVYRMSTEGEPARGDGPTVRVPAGTRDPLGAFFALRTNDWERSAEVSMPVFDGKKLYELRARKVSGVETVEVPAGSFKATQIELRVYERNREVLTAQFQLWLAKDAARTPVLIEAELPFGSLRVELTRAR